MRMLARRLSEVTVPIAACNGDTVIRVGERVGWLAASWRLWPIPIACGSSGSSASPHERWGRSRAASVYANRRSPSTFRRFCRPSSSRCTHSAQDHPSEDVLVRYRAAIEAEQALGEQQRHAPRTFAFERDLPGPPGARLAPVDELRGRAPAVESPALRGRRLRGRRGSRRATSDRPRRARWLASRGRGPLRRPEPPAFSDIRARTARSDRRAAVRRRPRTPPGAPSCSAAIQVLSSGSSDGLPSNAQVEPRKPGPESTPLRPTPAAVASKRAGCFALDAGQPCARRSRACSPPRERSTRL
jgi:hypothetical protein